MTIIFGGLTECSFSDFPNTISAVAFTVGCNLECRYCHNPQLIKPHYQKERLNTFSDLYLLQRLEHLRGKVDAVVITGGEPLIYDERELLRLIVGIKELGFMFVKLDTNGHFPEKLKVILNSPLLDYVAMDIKDDEDGYKSKKLCGHGSNWNKVKESIDLLKFSGVSHEFRTTCVGGYHSVEKIRNIAQVVGDDANWYLQACVTRHKTLCEDVTEPLPEEMQGLLTEAKKYAKKVELR